MKLPDNAVQLSWDEIHQLTLQLSETILKSGQQFDAMVVVPRGSYYPVNIIARQFGLGATDLLHACVSSYPAPGERQEFKLGQMPPKELVTSKRLLIVEEVCDTGHTLRFLTGWLKEQGASSVQSAAIHYKPTQSQTDFVPDWYAAETNEWIVYPWEAYERQDD